MPSSGEYLATSVSLDDHSRSSNEYFSGLNTTSGMTACPRLSSSSSVEICISTFSGRSVSVSVSPVSVSGPGSVSVSVSVSRVSSTVSFVSVGSGSSEDPMQPVMTDAARKKTSISAAILFIYAPIFRCSVCIFYTFFFTYSIIALSVLFMLELFE